MLAYADKVDVNLVDGPLDPGAVEYVVEFVDFWEPSLHLVLVHEATIPYAREAEAFIGWGWMVEGAMFEV